MGHLEILRFQSRRATGPSDYLPKFFAASRNFARIGFAICTAQGYMVRCAPPTTYFRVQFGARYRATGPSGPHAVVWPMSSNLTTVRPVNEDVSIRFGQLVTAYVLVSIRRTYPFRCWRYRSFCGIDPPLPCLALLYTHSSLLFENGREESWRRTVRCIPNQKRPG